jgi:hypothetical protein
MAGFEVIIYGRFWVIAEDFYTTWIGAGAGPTQMTLMKSYPLRRLREALPLGHLGCSCAAFSTSAAVTLRSWTVGTIHLLKRTINDRTSQD